jgi:hypothetical protein
MQDWHAIVAVLCLFLGGVCFLFGLLFICPPEVPWPWWKRILFCFGGFLGALISLSNEFKGIGDKWRECIVARRLVIFGLLMFAVAGTIFWWWR